MYEFTLRGRGEVARSRPGINHLVDNTEYQSAGPSRRLCVRPSLCARFPALIFLCVNSKVCVCFYVCVFLCVRAVQTSPRPSCPTKCLHRWLSRWRNWTSAREPRKRRKVGVFDREAFRCENNLLIHFKINYCGFFLLSYFLPLLNITSSDYCRVLEHYYVKKTARRSHSTAGILQLFYYKIQFIPISFTN